MKNYLGAIALMCLLIVQGCKQEGSYEVSGNLNLPDGAAVTLWPDDHAHQVAGTSIANNKFDINVDGIPEGVYDLIVSWPDPNFLATKTKNGSFLATPDSLTANVRLYLEPGNDYALSSPVNNYKTVYAPTTANQHPYPLAVATSSLNTKELHQILDLKEKITFAYRRKLDSLDVIGKALLAKNDEPNYGKIMTEYEGLGKSFHEREQFKATENFINSHRSSAISAYLIATAPNLKEEKAYFKAALLHLDPKLKDIPYAKEAKRRTSL